MNEIRCAACGETVPSDGNFCDQCGAALLKPEAPVQSAPAIALKARNGGFLLKPEPGAVIGRSDSPYEHELSSLNLISRRHGQFIKRGADWWIVDFGSTNGTYVNDRELVPEQPVKLKAGDVVDLGTYLFDVVET